jgi:hypothetical protein
LLDLGHDAGSASREFSRRGRTGQRHHYVRPTSKAKVESRIAIIGCVLSYDLSNRDLSSDADLRMSPTCTSPCDTSRNSTSLRRG